MEIFFEIFLEFFQEVLIQVLFEVMGESGSQWMAKRGVHPFRAWIAAFGFVLWGLLCGALSLWLVLHSFIRDPGLRLVALFLTPLIAGSAMAMIGYWRATRGMQRVRMDRFVYAVIFAFCLALVRYRFAA